MSQATAKELDKAHADFLRLGRKQGAMPDSARNLCFPSHDPHDLVPLAGSVPVLCSEDLPGLRGHDPKPKRQYTPRSS